MVALNIYILAFLLFFQFTDSFDRASKSQQPSTLPDSLQRTYGASASNIIFKSADGGQTWQDISAGLPVNLQADRLVEKDNELYIRAENGIYHGKPNSTAPFWEKEITTNESGSMASGKTGTAYNYGGTFLKKMNGTGFWEPMYTNLQEKDVSNVFETAGGTVFVVSNKGFFKSTDHGKIWKQVYNQGWVMKVVESNGILMATSQNGILRSTDDGENWESVLSEGGVGIDVARIKGGFAAINYNTDSETRRVRASYDGGKSWQAIDAGIPGSLSTASITEVGEFFFCGHPNGIYRSSDKGKTWKLLLPSIGDKVFNLSVSGNVIYAIPKSGGC